MNPGNRGHDAGLIPAQVGHHQITPVAVGGGIDGEGHRSEARIGIGGIGAGVGDRSDPGVVERHETQTRDLSDMGKQCAGDFARALVGDDESVVVDPDRGPGFDHGSTRSSLDRNDSDPTLIDIGDQVAVG